MTSEKTADIIEMAVEAATHKKPEWKRENREVIEKNSSLIRIDGQIFDFTIIRAESNILRILRPYPFSPGQKYQITINFSSNNPPIDIIEDPYIPSENFFLGLKLAFRKGDYRELDELLDSVLQCY